MEVIAASIIGGSIGVIVPLVVSGVLRVKISIGCRMRNPITVPITISNDDEEKETIVDLDEDCICDECEEEERLCVTSWNQQEAEEYYEQMKQSINIESSVCIQDEDDTSFSSEEKDVEPPHSIPKNNVISTEYDVGCRTFPTFYRPLRRRIPRT